MQTSDLNELKQLVAELRAEHVAQKEKEKRESWIKYVSLTMVIVAVLAAIAALQGGGYSTRSLKEMNEATFNQTQASDQWAYYQSKSIKENLFEIEQDHLQAVSSPDPAAVAKVKGRIDKFEKDKADITAKAKGFEDARDQARKVATSAAEHSRQMGLSITLYQIAVALGAMCLIVKRKPLWIASSTLATLATIKMAYVLWILPL